MVAGALIILVLVLLGYYYTYMMPKSCKADTDCTTPKTCQSGSCRALPALASNVLALGATLKPGQSLTSLNKMYNASMQTDGDFIVSNTSSKEVLYSLNSNYRNKLQAGSYITMSKDPNALVIYGPSNIAEWQTPPAPLPQHSLVLGDNGSLVIQDINGTTIWTLLLPANS